jgi:hypothetical protein
MLDQEEGEGEGEDMFNQENEEENSDEREDFFLPPTIMEQLEKKEEVKVAAFYTNSDMCCLPVSCVKVVS